MTGAAQWQMPCEHLEGRPAERSMHSEVSRNNHEYFVSENRVTDAVSESDLREWLARADADGGSLVACNQCRQVKIVNRDDGDAIVLDDGGVRA